MRKVLLALTTLLLVTAPAWAQSSRTPQSLAELARKVRAQRAKKDLSKIPFYTNDSIPKTGAPISIVGKGRRPAAEASEGVTATAEGEAAAEGEAEECGEQCWRVRFREQREKIRTAQYELDILQREYKLARTQYYQDPNQAVREQYSGNTAGGRELQDLLNRINEKQAEIQRLQQELAALEDELRRSGGQPGWAREQ